MAAGNPLAVQMYTFREIPKSERPAVLRAVKEAGYGAVQPTGDLSDAKVLRAELDEVGLGVTGFHGHVERDGVGPTVEVARTLGTDTVLIPVLEREGWDDVDTVRRLAAQVNDLGRHVAEAGLRLGYHNHYFEMAPIDGRAAIELFADALDPEIFLELDVYWAAVGGQDPVALLERLGDRVRYLHLKDGPADDRDAPMTALGDGVLPLERILAAAPQTEWPIVELDRCATDVLTAVKDSATWWREHGYATEAR